MPYSGKRCIILLFAVLFAVNCAAFRSDIEGKFGGTPDKHYGAAKSTVLFIFSHRRQAVGFDAIPKLLSDRQRIRGFQDIFADALQEITNVEQYATFTNYATDVDEPERRDQKNLLIAEHDFVIDSDIMRKHSFAKHFLGTVGSSVTATLLPMAYSHDYTFTVKVFDAQGRLLKEYVRSADLTRWVQTFLVFLQPFHTERRKEEEIYITILHDVFRQIEAEKILIQ